jgi:hypothetical protein
MSSVERFQNSNQQFFKNQILSNQTKNYTKETNNEQTRPYSSVFSKLALVNDCDDVEKERNRVKYLQNELEKQTTLCDYQKSVCSKSQTKIQYKKNLQALIIQVNKF